MAWKVTNSGEGNMSSKIIPVDMSLDMEATESMCLMFKPYEARRVQTALIVFGKRNP